MNDPIYYIHCLLHNAVQCYVCVTCALLDTLHCDIDLKRCNLLYLHPSGVDMQAYTQFNVATTVLSHWKLEDRVVEYCCIRSKEVATLTASARMYGHSLCAVRTSKHQMRHVAGSFRDFPYQHPRTTLLP